MAMIQCPNCNSTIDDTGAAFCPNCGSPVTRYASTSWVCPTCGATLDANTRFCPTATRRSELHKNAGAAILRLRCFKLWETGGSFQLESDVVAVELEETIRTQQA